MQGKYIHITDRHGTDSKPESNADSSLSSCIRSSLRAETEGRLKRGAGRGFCPSLWPKPVPHTLLTLRIVLLRVVFEHTPSHRRQ